MWQNLTVGARYNPRDGASTWTSITEPGPRWTFTNPESGKRNSKRAPTWRVSLDRQTDGITSMGYVVVQIAALKKPAGFTITGTTNQPPYAPEKLDAYEVGHSRANCFQAEAALERGGLPLQVQGTFRLLEAGTPSISTVKCRIRRP